MKELIKTLFEVAGSYAGQIKKMLLFDVLKAVFEGFSLSAVLFCLMKVCQSIFNGHEIVMRDIYLVFLIALMSTVGKVFFGYLADKNKYMASYSLGAENRLYIGDRLKHINMGYFGEESLGKLAGGLTTVIGELETVGVMMIEQILVGAIQTFIMVIFVLPYDIVTAIIVLITLGSGMLVSLFTQRKTDQLTETLLDLKLDLNTKTLEYVKGIGITKSFSKEKETAKELNHCISKMRDGFLAVEKALVPTQFCFLLVFKMGICAIIISSIMRYVSGDIDGTKSILLIVSSFVVFSGFELAGSMQSIRGVAVQNLNQTMQLRTLPMMEQGDITQIEEEKISLVNVSFSYDKINVLENINLEIPSGTTTAVVGFSGSGKTTLCHLIARFWDVNTGEIKIGNQNIQEYQCDALLSNFSFVFQDVYLFDDTVRNNIKFGKPSATDEEMIEIAKKAQCHDFIMALPNGYDTVLLEGGSNISGGERQRLSIARAMLKPSKFVILDEATSSVDPENEKELLLALKQLLKNKTTIVIAHKLSTIKNADYIIVLNDGKMEQVGTHQDLVEKTGTYKNFFENRKKSEDWGIELLH
ncbi:ABC transporter ATP-binding protein [Streptococcus cameli]